MGTKNEKLTDKIKQLDELVNYFEKNDDFDLEAGIANYEQAMKLVQELKKELLGYELKIKEVEAKYQEAQDEQEPESAPDELNV